MRHRPASREMPDRSIAPAGQDLADMLKLKPHVPAAPVWSAGVSGPQRGGLLMPQSAGRVQ